MRMTNLLVREIRGETFVTARARMRGGNLNLGRLLIDAKLDDPRAAKILEAWLEKGIVRGQPMETAKVKG